MRQRFVAWDGEGVGDKLVLLANSDGQTLYRAEGISTEEAFQFLLSGPKDVINVWFGMGWDVNMIVGTIPLENHRSIRTLYDTNRVIWKGYTIRYIARKMFDVSRVKYGERRTFKSVDVQGFFQSSFIQALREWKISVPHVVTRGKKAREDFGNWNPENVIAYNALECELLVELMDRFREAVKSAGWAVRSWHGAGALAAEWLRTRRAKDHIRRLPPRVEEAAHYAYFGGRIEMAAWGRYRPVYHYDIRSAYPAALAECPDLAFLTWRKRKRLRLEDVPDFSLLHVAWDVQEGNPDHPLWAPLPWRDNDGTILYPPNGRGWYWAVEVKAAVRRWRRLRRRGMFHIREAWIPEGEFSYPLADPLHEDYARRLAYKKEGHPADVPMKLALNSLYGKLAQRQGIEGKKPPYSCLAWAGYITARTRARLSDALMQARDRVICTMTDSVWSLVPLPQLEFSDEMGSWQHEDDDVALDLIEAGVYRSHQQDGTTYDYSRGYDKDTPIRFDEIINRWSNGKVFPYSNGSITRYKMRRFVGMGLALHFPTEYRPHWRQFITISREIDSVPLHGTTKRECYGPRTKWLVPRERPDRRRTLSYPYKPVRNNLGVRQREAKEDALLQECDE